MTMGLLLLFCWLQLSVHQYAVNVFNAFSFQWVQELKVVWARSLQIDGHFFLMGTCFFKGKTRTQLRNSMAEWGL